MVGKGDGEASYAPWKVLRTTYPKDTRAAQQAKDRRRAAAGKHNSNGRSTSAVKAGNPRGQGAR